MKRQVWADEDVTTSVNANFIPVAIDVDNPDAAAVRILYSVGGTPSHDYYRCARKCLAMASKGISKSEFLELLREPNPSVTKDL